MVFPEDPVFVSGVGDVIVNVDSNETGEGDFVLVTRGEERGRVANDGTGSGVFAGGGGSQPITAVFPVDASGGAGPTTIAGQGTSVTPFAEYDSAFVDWHGVDDDGNAWFVPSAQVYAGAVYAGVAVVTPTGDADVVVLGISGGNRDAVHFPTGIALPATTPPEVPALVTAQDLATALVSIGLITQAS